MLEDMVNLPTRNDKRVTAPKESWRPHLELDADGGYFVSSPRKAGDEPDHADLLAEFDLDASQWIVTGLRRSKWQRYDGEWLEAFRVSLAPATARGELLRIPEQLEDEIRKWRPRKGAKPATGDLTAMFVSSDMQWGKVGGDGTEGTIQRSLNGIQSSVDRFKELKSRGIGQIALPQLGDCVEGNVSQGGRLRTDISISQQIRLGRRMLLQWVKTFAPFTESLLIPVVPGNHDETTRQIITDPMDSWQVEIVAQVMDIARENPTLQHVQGIFAEADNSTLMVEMSGEYVAFAHGHQIRDPEKWFAGQALGQTPVGSANILISAHFHHYKVTQLGPRLHIQTPAIDVGSPWFRDRRGMESPPGIVSLVVGEGYDPRRDLVVLPV